MPIEVRIVGNNGRTADVDEQGSLKVLPREFNLIQKRTMDGTGVFSFFPPKAGKQFIISGIIMNAARSVTNEALITIFEATSEAGALETEIVAIDIAKSVTTPLLDINVLVSEGVWVNGTTDDPTCNVTVIGYYVEAESS